MNYKEELNVWLDKLVDVFLDKVIVDKDNSRETLEDFKNEIRSKVVESYRNGIKTGLRKGGHPKSQKREN